MQGDDWVTDMQIRLSLSQAYKKLLGTVHQELEGTPLHSCPAARRLRSTNGSIIHLLWTALDYTAYCNKTPLMSQRLGQFKDVSPRGPESLLTNIKWSFFNRKFYYVPINKLRL